MKVGQVIVSSADTIVISAFLGLAANAFYNNYYYVLTAVTGIMNVVFVSCTAGIGNSILVETEEKNYTDLKKLSFIIMWLAGMCSAVMLCLYHAALGNREANASICSRCLHGCVFLHQPGKPDSDHLQRCSGNLA